MPTGEGEMRIDVTISGLEAWINRIKRIPGGRWIPAALSVFGNYLVKGLREYAQWRKVTRQRAYGRTFFSTKQQRAFFAKLKSGEINVPYMRTGAQGKAWRYEGMKGANTGIVANRTKSVGFTRGQTKLHSLMRWKTALQHAKENAKGALKAVKAMIIEIMQKS